MINELIRQLQNPDPDIRRKAIIAIGKSKDATALQALIAVVKGDPDPELRDLARKAGLYIRQQSKQGTQPVLPHISPFKAPGEAAEEPASPASLRFKNLADEERRKQMEQIEEPDIPELGLVGDSIGDADIPDQGRFKNDNLYDLQPDEITALPSNRGKSAKDAPDSPPALTGTSLVRGRQYNVLKPDQDRAKQYTDAALSLNIEGNNAKAMKSLTEALSLNPNLINDSYFSGVANAVTGLDGDAAIQMIVDRDERKRFTETASKDQKNRRVEKHMGEALQSTWTDFWFELIVYSLIVIIGPIFATLVLTEMTNNLINTIAQSTAALPPEVQAMQASLAGISAASLLPIGIVSGLTGIFSLLLQTVLIHFLAKMLGGTGTWRHLMHVLLSFYNKWFPRLFLLGYLHTSLSPLSRRFRPCCSVP